MASHFDTFVNLEFGRLMGLRITLILAMADILP